MKHSKWLKWKIGAMGTLGLALLFHGVKANPAFDKAVANASASSNNTLSVSTQAQDSVMDDFSASFNDQQNQSNSDQQNQSNSQLDQGQAFNSHSHTKTGRS
jgi:hypothetical protein